MVFYAGSIEEAKDWLVQQDEKRHQGGLGLRYSSDMLA
jgi:elongation factor P hydroxylase